MRVRLAAAPLLLTVALVAGCGSDDGGSDGDSASDETTAEEFCDAYGAVEETEDFESTKGAIGELRDLGLPEDAPEDAVAGFEVLADLAEEAGDEEEAAKLGEDVDAEGQEQVNAFFTYSTETCAPESESPSEGESDAPSGDEETE